MPCLHQSHHPSPFFLLQEEPLDDVITDIIAKSKSVADDIKEAEQKLTELKIQRWLSCFFRPVQHKTSIHTPPPLHSRQRHTRHRKRS